MGLPPSISPCPTVLPSPDSLRKPSSPKLLLLTELLVQTLHDGFERHSRPLKRINLPLPLHHFGFCRRSLRQHPLRRRHAIQTIQEPRRELLPLLVRPLHPRMHEQAPVAQARFQSIFNAANLFSVKSDRHEGNPHTPPSRLKHKRVIEGPLGSRNVHSECSRPPQSRDSDNFFDELAGRTLFRERMEDEFSFNIILPQDHYG